MPAPVNNGVHPPHVSGHGPVAEGRAGVNQVQRAGAESREEGLEGLVGTTERGSVCVQLREASAG